MTFHFIREIMILVETITSPTNVSNKNLLTVVLITIMIGVSIAAAYFFIVNRSLSQDLSETQEKNVQIEKDLIFYKSADLAKEIEIVNLKLKVSEEKNEETKKKLTISEANLNTLRQNLSLIPKITNTLTLMMTTFGKQAPDCYNSSDKTNIKQGLEVIGDSKLMSLWDDFINGTTSSNCSFSPNLLELVVNYGLSKIAGISTR